MVGLTKGTREKEVHFDVSVVKDLIQLESVRSGWKCAKSVALVHLQETLNLALFAHTNG